MKRRKKKMRRKKKKEPTKPRNRFVVPMNRRYPRRQKMRDRRTRRSKDTKNSWRKEWA